MHKASQRPLQGAMHCLVLPVTMQLGKCLCTGHIEEEEEEEEQGGNEGVEAALYMSLVWRRTTLSLLRTALTGGFP